MNFVAPLFLAGVACMAVPWLLHRFSHEDPEQQAFPSMRFLEAVPPPVSQRRRLRYLTLLALRCLGILLLCLAFARPWFDTMDSGASVQSEHLVIVDRSLSMRADERFDRAVDRALELVDGLPADDTVRLFVADSRLIELTGEGTSVDNARAALQGLSASDARADKGVVMRRIDGLASESRLPVQAYFITDAQSSALPVRRNELLAPSLTSLEVIPVGSEIVSNAGLSARASSSDGALMRIVVTVQGFGVTDGDTREFVIRHEGAELVRESVILIDGVAIERVFDDLPVPAGESPVLEIAFTQEDALISDDAVNVAVQLGGTRRVVVAGFSDTVPNTPGVFLRAAMNTGAGARMESAAANARTLPEDTRHAIVFAAPGDVEAMAAVRRQTDRGVNVLVVPAVNGASGSGNADERDARVAQVDEAHPSALGDLSWTGVRLYGAQAFDVEDSDEVLIFSTSGAPLLLERESSGGRLVILNDPIDGLASNLPHDPVFVELVARLVDWFDAAGAIPERLFVGDLLALPARTQVFGPDGSALAELAEIGEGTALTLHDKGVYRVVDSRGERFVHLVTDPRESDLRAIDEVVRINWQARHGGESPDTSLIDMTTADATSVQRRTSTPDDRQLWHLLIILVAILVIAESFFANRHLSVRRDGS